MDLEALLKTPFIGSLAGSSVTAAVALLVATKQLRLREKQEASDWFAQVYMSEGLERVITYTLSITSEVSLNKAESLVPSPIEALYRVSEVIQMNSLLPIHTSVWKFFDEVSSNLKSEVPSLTNHSSKPNPKTVLLKAN